MALGETAARRARVAFQRLGLGPKPGGPARIGASPRAAVQAEIDNPTQVLISDPTLPTYAQACAAGGTDFTAAHAILEAELRARYTKALAPEVGFTERLVRFWTNHFSMSINKSEIVRATLGQLEREVIRPNVLGRFEDMLLGVMRHPAMMSYLDNENSIGPNSPIGISWGVGLNENLARELLELHTLGVEGGYTERDVTNTARIITGWSYVRGWESDGGWNGGNATNRGQFIFRPDWHEPGAHTVMGKRYGGSGIAQGERLLRDLAIHAKTAEHIAYKLVRHFITDTPEPAMVQPLKDAFLATGGDLRAVAKALVDLTSTWRDPFNKIRQPDELTIAQFRAFSLPVPPPESNWAVTEPLRALRNMPWERSPPDGYPDETGPWLSPDGMRLRSDTAQLFVDVLSAPMQTTPETLAAELFDDALSPSSLTSIAAGTTRRAKLTALLMTPEFQRR